MNQRDQNELRRRLRLVQGGLVSGNLAHLEDESPGGRAVAASWRVRREIGALLRLRRAAVRQAAAGGYALEMAGLTRDEQLRLMEGALPLEQQGLPPVYPVEGDIRNAHPSPGTEY